MKLPVRMKLAYGASDFGFSMAGTIIGIYLLKFVVDVVGLRPALAGGALLVGKIWDAVIDPFIGHFSDRVRTRWGRRRPFLLWFFAPYSATFILIWLLPTFHNQWLLAVVFTLLNMLFITFFSLLMVPYNALAPEMTRDYDERTSVNAYRMAFSIIGGLVASAIPLFLVNLFGKNIRLGYRVMGLTFGLLISVFPFIAFWGTREEAHTQNAAMPSLLSGLRAAAKNRPFLLSLTGFLTNWVAIDIISATFLFYLVYWMRFNDTLSQLVLLTIFGVAILCLPIWVIISRRLGKKIAYISGLGFLAIILITLVFLQPGHAGLIFAVAAAAGIGVSAAHVIPYSIIPDAIEYDEYHTGENRDGIYFGLLTFLQQLASSGALFLVGVFLDLSGYVPNAVQTPSTLWTIRLLLGAFPGVLLLLGILAVSFYPITRTEHQRIVAALAERKTAAGQPSL